ncbi:hypothetical protein V2L00_05105, partial [Pseudomonas alliivorans]|nr:hypothetical protein [Pseudomonas alliivorans]
VTLCHAGLQPIMAGILLAPTFRTKPKTSTRKNTLQTSFRPMNRKLNNPFIDSHFSASNIQDLRMGT